MSATSSDRRSVAVLVVLVLLFGGASRWWASRQDDAIGRSLQAVARSGDILLLSAQSCAFCTEARQWMNSRGVPFDECFVERDAACAQRWRALALPGTPVVLVRGRAQLGFDPQRVLHALSQS